MTLLKREAVYRPTRKKETVECPALGGEVVHATAMFVDLRGFTAMTRRNDPTRVVSVLTEYYALVERVCEREVGDALKEDEPWERGASVDP